MDEEREKERERESDRAYQIISDAQRFGYSCNTPSLRFFFFFFKFFSVFQIG